MDYSEAKLNELGYRQDLRRALSQFGSLAVALSVGSVLSALTSSFSIGYSHGGPALLVWSWLLHTLLGLCCWLSLAELCSSIPTAGSMFTWNYFLAGRYRRFWCWITGWVSLLAWIAGTASAGFVCAYLVSTMVVLGGGGAFSGGTKLTSSQTLGIVISVLFCQGLLNLLPIRILSYFNKLNFWLNLVGAVGLIALLPALAVKRQTASFVFTYFDRQSFGYVLNDGYTALIGFLYVVYALSGMDAAAHMAEETWHAGRLAARSIYLSFLINSALGFALLLAFLFSLQETSADMLVSGQAGGFMVAQIIYDLFFARFGSASGALAVLGVITAAVFLGGLSSLTVASRILWAFARDGAIPLSTTWQKVSRGARTPMNAVASTTVLSMLISLPLLRSSVAFSACVSIGILGGATSFVIPIALKAFGARGSFKPGPVWLGRFSLPINCVAIAYLVLICGAACLPTIYPVTRDTLNYSPITYGSAVVAALVYWGFPGKHGARNWFLLDFGNLQQLNTPNASCATDPKLSA